MNKPPRHHHYPRPPPYAAERDPLLQPSSSSSWSPRSDPRNPAGGGGAAAAQSGIRQRADLNALFVAVFGALAGISVWLVVKSSRPDGVSLVDWYFIGLMALAEWTLEVTWVNVVWPRKVWRTGGEEAHGRTVGTVQLLFLVKVALFGFNWVFAHVGEEALPFSWGMAWIAGFVSVDFALAVVLSLFYH